MKAKSITIILIFALILFGFASAHMILPDTEASYSERRKLEQMPSPSIKSILNGSFADDFEKYMLDQFPLRDTFRTLKANVEFDLLLKKDNHGVYLIGDSVFKTEYPLKENQVRYSADRINEVFEKHLKNANVYYSIIPDKNYFTARENGYPSIDYSKMFSIMRENIDKRIKYINITDLLSEHDYYRTDTHWRQECILDAANRILTEMDIEHTVLESSYEIHSLMPFYGAYYGQSALNVPPDKLLYLTNDTTENASVWSLDMGEKATSVYSPEKFYGMDGYDVFLSGAQSVMIIENNKAETSRELVIFRDSYASSLSPLFIEAYKKITLIDLRYISSSLIGEYIPDGNFDALFLYSTLLLNNGMLLK